MEMHCQALEQTRLCIFNIAHVQALLVTADQLQQCTGRECALQPFTVYVQILLMQMCILTFGISAHLCAYHCYVR